MLRAVAEQRAESAARLSRAIEASGKSFETLAHEAGVSVKTISRWVNQRHDPARETVKRVAKALNVDPDWLWQPPAPLGLGAEGDDPYTLLEQINGKLDKLLEVVGVVDEDVAEATRVVFPTSAPRSGRSGASGASKRSRRATR